MSYKAAIVFFFFVPHCDAKNVLFAVVFPFFFSESAGSRGAQWWVAFEILEYETVNPRLRYFRTYTCTYVYMSTYEKHRVTLNYSHVSLVSLGVRITAPRHRVVTPVICSVMLPFLV
ncbi:hypothetical protein, unlikely [Trypanosoma brucei gambiense DAL972]|uniref:T. brucei spp.-specific protein n=1 Tax=Trypanosoma brucei gambiense (strain MHOM/CI/86/DAL972) TaxID=679716 RepID=C9ZSM1_TRYB9|nr:hypothetical protein, unlikely [Trypanosoma brucei gambiense DAL972]CBH12405.1 hypothetical protein, unlikely [Trypanosoma brucei gambiense DAL972]|eukprot:XP_011774686.1 hypothetical protein, unlikely [Trypanosoma brucei gambiense DAL972]